MIATGPGPQPTDKPPNEHDRDSDAGLFDRVADAVTEFIDGETHSEVKD